ncbi:hypothetical protein [Moraxella lacunata]|uniref:hypothetical protein n=1 Tax=Moraxella lacunata TaxID=477 RepID=UPI003EE1288D
MMSQVMGCDVGLAVGAVRICLGLTVFGVSAPLSATLSAVVSAPVSGLGFLNRLLIFLNIRLPWLYFKRLIFQELA